MSNKKGSRTKQAVWTELSEQLQKLIPHLASWYNQDEDFIELRVKARDDGTYLAIAKGFDSDGGLVVCFGVGYGFTAALLAIDSTIQGGYWKVDKPWPGVGK